jgi:hypothetical protein
MISGYYLGWVYNQVDLGIVRHFGGSKKLCEMWENIRPLGPRSTIPHGQRSIGQHQNTDLARLPTSGGLYLARSLDHMLAFAVPDTLIWYRPPVRPKQAEHS